MAHIDPTPVDRWVDDRLATLTPAAWQPDLPGRLAELHRRQAQRRAHQLRWTAASVVVIGVCVSLPVTRAFGARCVGACVYATTRVTQWWGADEPAAAAPKVVGATIGDLAPDNLGTGANGSPLSLASLRGHVVVLNFWATWCEPCRSEIPLLNALESVYGSQGLRVVGMSLDKEGWAAITPFLAEQAATYSITAGTDDIADAFGGVSALPMTFIIDRDGVIAAKVVGPIHAGVHDELIQKLLRLR
jgi:thiol-disulfide isomerase/thioredoxin